MTSGSAPLRVVIVTTHPIQYQVPWIRGLAAWPGLRVHTLFGMLPDAAQQGTGFGVAFHWDVPLTEGYEWTVLENRAKEPSLARRDGIDTPGVGEHLTRLDPDVVIVCGWQSRCLVQATRAARRQRRALLVRGESNALRVRPLWKRLLHRRWLAQFDGALAIGRSNAEFLRQAGVPAERIHQAPYGVDERHLGSAVRDGPALRSHVRERLGIPQDAVVVLFVGKLQPKKRPMDLVEAMGRVQARQPQAWLLMLGAGELAPQAQARAQELGLRASFPGFWNQGEIGGAYAASDLLVLPSDHGETWGLVVNEAQVCGLPVVVSDRVGCGPDLVEAGITGYVVPCGDVPALAERIDQLVADPALRARLGAAGRARVADYSIARAVAGTAQAVHAVARRRTEPGA